MENVEATVQALLSLAGGRQAVGAPLDEFVVGAATSTDVELAGEARERSAGVLSRALANEALTISAKAWELLTDNQANFRQTRVVTEVRPIFADSGEAPPAGLVVHLLRLTYWGEDGDHAFWVAMDGFRPRPFRGDAALAVRSERAAYGFSHELKTFALVVRPLRNPAVSYCSGAVILSPTVAASGFLADGRLRPEGRHLGQHRPPLQRHLERWSEAVVASTGTGC
jgi:hypothetical protein